MGNVQGLGEGPAGILVATAKGHVYLCNRQKKPLPLSCVLADPPVTSGSATCLAAADEVVVTGAEDGTIEVLQMNNPMGS
jgi:hypothetical protein